MQLDALGQDANGGDDEGGVEPLPATRAIGSARDTAWIDDAPHGKLAFPLAQRENAHGQNPKVVTGCEKSPNRRV
jgi:hypothetical protein